MKEHIIRSLKYPQQWYVREFRRKKAGNGFVRNLSASISRIKTYMEQVSNTHIEIELSRYKPLLASMLSEKRLTHCIGSAFMAYELAHDSGFDEQSAFRSALLHDIAKEFSFDTQKEYAHTCPFPVPTYAFENRHRLHGFAAAGFLYAGNYPFSYMELHAIAFHTIGSE